MTKPVVPKGQEIQIVLEKLTRYARFVPRELLQKTEQEIREIIAQQIEDEIATLADKTLLDFGVYAPKGTNVSVFHGLYGAANMVRGKTPITEEQWNQSLADSVRRNDRGPRSVTRDYFS